MESELNKNYINYTIKTFHKNDDLTATNAGDGGGGEQAYIYSMKPQYITKYPEFTSLQKNHDYLSLYDINKVDYSTNQLNKNDNNKRYSGYFNLADVATATTKNLKNDEIYKQFIISENNKINELKNSNLDLKQSDKANSSVSETSLAGSRKLSFGKSPDQTHLKITDLNESNKSPDLSTISYSENEILINEKRDQIETQITAQTIYKKDEAQASPLFLKIMSKLSELPDSMLFTNTNNRSIETEIHIESSSNTPSINSNNNNSSTHSNEPIQINESKNVTNEIASTLPGVRLNEKALKSLNKRNIVIVRRPTAPAPTPPQLLLKQNLNRSLNKESKVQSYLEDNILQKPSLNIMQRNPGLKLRGDDKRAKHRSMYVDSDIYSRKEYLFESDLGNKKGEKYSSHLVEGLNVFATPTSYLTKIKEINLETRTDNTYKDFRKNLLKDLENEKSKKKREDNLTNNLNQIEESLKCFSYLDNLDDSISTDDNNNKVRHQDKANESKTTNYDRFKSLKQSNKSESNAQNDSKEVASLTIQTPSSLNYNIRMNTNEKPNDNNVTTKTHHSEEPTIKLRSKNNELVASINIIESSLTNGAKMKSDHKDAKSSRPVVDEKIEEIEKTANFDISSNDSETENSYDTRKSSNYKKNIVIKKVKTEQTSPRKYDHLRLDSSNTAKITNNYNNNVALVNNQQRVSSSSKKTSKIVDIHLIEKPKHSDQLKHEEKIKVKVPVIHTTAATTSVSTRPLSNVFEQIENEKSRNRVLKKHSSDKESKSSEKSKIVIKKVSHDESSKYNHDLKRFNGIVGNSIDSKRADYKPSDRTALLSERPKTTVPMDTLSSAQHHATFLRKISTPPPLPNILDKLDLLNSPKSNHYNYDHLDHEIKVINSNHVEAKNNISSNLRPVSITSSIRSGKSEKPLRLNHGIPPPPSLNIKDGQKYNICTTTHHPSSSKNRYNDLNSKKILPLTSNVITKLKLSENSSSKKSSNHENELFIKETKSRPADSHDDTKKDKYKVQATIKKTEKPASSQPKKISIDDESKSKPKTLVLNGMSTNIPVDENFGGRCTNLPQLGAIDYIYKTSDDRYMTSQSPFNYDKKPKSKDSDKTNKHPASNETPSTNRKNTTQQQKQFTNNDEMIDKYDSTLPWASKDLKNGKNFYENYAKENDRRKKEGNGFLMLLPGIAIPIDTDANDSDEDPNSDSLD